MSAIIVTAGNIPKSESRFWPRHGQWVQLDLDGIDGAHRAKDGRAVGIFQRAGKVKVQVLKGGKMKDEDAHQPDRINIVDPEGFNLMTFKGGQVGHVVVLLESALNLQTCAREDIPAARLATAAPNWEPK